MGRVYPIILQRTTRRCFRSGFSVAQNLVLLFCFLCAHVTVAASASTKGATPLSKRCTAEVLSNMKRSECERTIANNGCIEWAWVGVGCDAPGGGKAKDGGCQKTQLDGSYCDFSCRSRCLAMHGVCTWVNNYGCFRKRKCTGVLLGANNLPSSLTYSQRAAIVPPPSPSNLLSTGATSSPRIGSIRPGSWASGSVTGRVFLAPPNSTMLPYYATTVEPNQVNLCSLELSAVVNANMVDLLETELRNVNLKLYHPGSNQSVASVTMGFRSSTLSRYANAVAVYTLSFSYVHPYVKVAPRITLAPAGSWLDVEVSFPRWISVPFSLITTAIPSIYANNQCVKLKPGNGEPSQEVCSIAPMVTDTLVMRVMS